MTLSVGFIGLGLIGAQRFKIIQELGHRIVFTVDPDNARREKCRAEGCRQAGSLDELGEIGERLDAVFIAVPHDLALACCRWALARGAHVLCEKPMGISLAQAEEIAALARQANLVFGAGFNYRYLPGVAALRDLVRAGDLGELFRVRIAMGHGGRAGMEKEWKLKRARAGGGALIDPGVHLVDLAHHLFGAPEVASVRFSRRFWESDIEDECLATLSIGGAAVELNVNLTSWKNSFLIEAYGSDGQAILTGRGGNYGSQRLEFTNRWFWAGQDRRFERDFGTADPSFALETRAFAALISGQEDDGILSRDIDGVAAMCSVSALYRAGGA